MNYFSGYVILKFQASFILEKILLRERKNGTIEPKIHKRQTINNHQSTVQLKKMTPGIVIIIDNAIINIATTARI